MKLFFRILGVLGTLGCIGLFIHEPSFPTPDKIFIFLTFVYMIFSQAWDMVKHFGPFLFILLAYDSFRGLVPSLNNHVHYTLMPNFDKLVFGTLPTVTLQHWLWHGHVQWYDFIFYGAYMLHFIMPVFIALLIWKFRESVYWELVTSYLLTSFAAFFVFLAYPTSPPWLASDKGYIPHITRISSAIYSAMGIKDAPSVYNKFAANPVAAVPSLHTAYSILFATFVFKYFGKKWGAVSLIYPFLIIFGIVYMGEHYVFDVVTGAALAVVCYKVSPFVLRQIRRLVQRIKSVKTVPEAAN